MGYWDDDKNTWVDEGTKEENDMKELKERVEELEKKDKPVKKPFILDINPNWA